MENLILSKLENLKINNNNTNFYNRDKELYNFLLSKDFYDQIFKILKINIPEDIKIFLINDLINQINEKKIRFFSSPPNPALQGREGKQGDEAAPLPPSSEGGTKKNYFDESSLDINSLLKDYLVSLPKEPKESCPSFGRREALPSFSREEGASSPKEDLLFIKNVDKKTFCASLLPKDGQEFVSTKNLIQEYILEEGFSYILGCIWKNGNIKTEYGNKLEFLNSKKKFLSSLSFPFTGEESIDSISYLSPGFLSVSPKGGTEKRENSLPLSEAQKRNLLLSFLHSKKKKDEIEYNLFCKETHTILKAIKEKFYNIDWLIEGKLCFIKPLPRAKHLPLLSVQSTVVGYEKEKNKYSLKAKKRKDIVSCLLLPKKAKEENFQRENDKKGFHAKHIPYVREHDAWHVKKKPSFLRLEEPTPSVLSEEQDKLINLFMKEGISKLEKVDYNWQGKTLLPVRSTERRAASSPCFPSLPCKAGLGGEEKNSKKKDPFFASFGEETKHSPPKGGAKLKRLDIFYNYIEKRIEPGQFTSLLREMINKRYKNIFLSSLSQKKEAKEGPLYIKMKQFSSGVRSKAKAHMIGKEGYIFLQRNSAPSERGAEKDRNPSFASHEISQIKIPCKSRVENKPSCASLRGQENPSLDINYSSLKYRLIDIYLSIFDLFIFSLKKEYNSLTRYMSYMGGVLKEGKSKIGKKGSRNREKIEGSTYIKMLEEQVFSRASHGDHASSQKSCASLLPKDGHFRCENCPRREATNRVSCKEEYKIRDLPSGVKSNPFLFFTGGNPCEALPSFSREDKGICISNHFSTFYNIYIIYLQFFEIGKKRNFMISPILYKDFFKFFDLWKESLKICPRREATNRVSCKEGYKVEYNVRSNEKDYLVSDKLSPKGGMYGKDIDIRKEQSCSYVKNNFSLPASFGGTEVIYQKTLRSPEGGAKHFLRTSDFIYYPINSNIKVDIIYYRFGLDFLIGIYGNYKTSQKMYRQIEDFLTENYYLSLEKHNLYNPSSNQTIFRNYQISFLEWKQYYRKIQSLTLYMGKNVKGNPSFLTRFSSLREAPSGEEGYSKFKYKISLNLPLLDIIRSLHKEGFCDGKGFPTSKKNWTILSDSRILKYFKNLLYSLRKYYSIIDYPKNWKKIEYILQHSCTMTIAHKHRTSLRKVLTFYGKKMRLNTDYK